MAHICLLIIPIYQGTGNHSNMSQHVGSQCHSCWISDLFRFVGPYTKLCPSLSFVLEDDEGVCGYVLAALDSKAFYEQFEKQWAPEVAKQYPIPQFGIKEFTPEEVSCNILKLILYSQQWQPFWLVTSLYS